MYKKNHTVLYIYYASTVLLFIRLFSKLNAKGLIIFTGEKQCKLTFSFKYFSVENSSYFCNNEKFIFCPLLTCRTCIKCKMSEIKFLLKVLISDAI